MRPPSAHWGVSNFLPTTTDHHLSARCVEQWHARMRQGTGVLQQLRCATLGRSRGMTRQSAGLSRRRACIMHSRRQRGACITHQCTPHAANAPMPLVRRLMWCVCGPTGVCVGGPIINRQGLIRGDCCSRPLPSGAGPRGCFPVTFPSPVLEDSETGSCDAHGLPHCDRYPLHAVLRAKLQVEEPASKIPNASGPVPIHDAAGCV